jgi:hypothetical protein
MSKATQKYMIITWWLDGHGDYTPTLETSVEFVSEKDLDDIKGLMKQHDVKRWIKDPETVSPRTFVEGDACLIEYRNVVVKPIKIVEAWGYSREKINE